MNSKVETVENKFDTPLLVLSALIVIAGIVGFYYFAEQSTLVRVLGLLAAVGIAIFVGMQTEKGRTTWTYIHEAQIEVRKVVWPSRQETIHTTFLVILMVFIIALMLMGIDWILKNIMGSILGHGG